MLYTGLKAGIPFDKIGDMALHEIALVIQADHDKKTEQSEMLMAFGYNLAVLFGVAINNPKRFPKMEDVIPSLAEKETEQGVQQDWRLMKARMEGFAKAKNGSFLSNRE